MAKWDSSVKHEPSEINAGNRYEKKDRLSREQLNAITENGFYAVKKSEEALEKANSAFTGNGTIARVNGVAQPFLDFKQDPNTSLMYYTAIYDVDVPDGFKTDSQGGVIKSFDVSEYDEIITYFITSGDAMTSTSVMSKVTTDLRTQSSNGTYPFVGTTTVSNNYHGFVGVGGSEEAYQKITVRVNLEKNVINFASSAFNWSTQTTIDYGRARIYRILGVRYGNSN
ncbi:hypothetical protein IJE86_08120 [bacterium]|nr:hypothetical protein [bacterium]